MERQLVIGYVGNGKSTNRYHMPLIMRRMDKVRVKTIYAPRLNAPWDRWDGVHYTDNMDELLGDPEIDVVIVTTPPHVHFQIAKQVIEAGKNVVLEKPFVPSVKEAEELFALARQHGVMIQGYQNRRFDSDFLTMQKVISSGKLGELFEVEMHWDYYRPEAPEGVDSYTAADSFVYSLACHPVDQVLSYFGMPDEKSFDVRQLLGTGRMNDYFDLDFYYRRGRGDVAVMPGGLKVSVKASYFRAKERPCLTVYGRRGMFVKAGRDKQEADLKKFYLPDHADFGLDTPADYGTLIYYDDEGHYHEESVETVPGDNGRYYDCLYETIVNGAEPLVTEEQTMAQMRLLEEATSKLG